MRHVLDPFAPTASAPLHLPASAGGCAACPDAEGGGGGGRGGGGGGGGDEDDDSEAAAEAEAGEDMAHMDRERESEARAREAFGAVAHFEATRCLCVSRMGAEYLAARPALVRRASEAGASLGLPPEVVHDSVLLLDRAMSTGATFGGAPLAAAAAACIYIMAFAEFDYADAIGGGGASSGDDGGDDLAAAAARVAAAAGVRDDELAAAEDVVRAALQVRGGGGPAPGARRAPLGALNPRATLLSPTAESLCGSRAPSAAALHSPPAVPRVPRGRL
jgi:hypothetical protein